MANNMSQARDGRMSLAWILEPKATQPTGNTLPKGTICYITEKASTDSVFGKTPVNRPFMANTDITLKTGDKCVIYEPFFLGQATEKSLESSKTSTDITMDYDASQNQMTDGIVQRSGSVSGMNIVESVSLKSGVNILKTRFSSITEIAADGSVDYKEAQTTEKDILMIIWNGRNAKEGEILDIDILPVLFTSESKSGSYNSPQGLNYNFSSLSSDEDGREPGKLQVHCVDGLIPGIGRPTK